MSFFSKAFEIGSNLISSAVSNDTSHSQQEKNKKEIMSKLIKMGYKMKYIQKAFKLYAKNTSNTYNIKVMIELIKRLKEKDNNNNNNNNNKANILEDIEKECKRLNWGLTKINQTNNDGIYACFALEIYGDIKQYNRIKIECIEYVNKNKGNNKSRCCWADKMNIDIYDVLCELYHIKVTIFEYNAKQKTIFISDSFGPFGNNTKHFPSIFIATFTLNNTPKSDKYFAVIHKHNALHSRPLKKEIVGNNNNNNNNQRRANKRKLEDQQDDIPNNPPNKRRKIMAINNKDCGIQTIQTSDNIEEIETKCKEYENKIGLLDEKMMQQTNVLNEYKKENDELKKEIISIKQELDLFHGASKSINTMNLDELNKLEWKLQTGIKMMQQAREQLLDSKFKCVACLQNEKNMVVDGCEHVALCKECEMILQPKLCPICQIPYTKAKKITY